MDKGSNPHDPRGLIFESYRMEGISIPECRTIFLDWALGQPAAFDARAAINSLLSEYGSVNPEHPMTLVLQEGRGETLEARRRGGRSGRKAR